MTADHHIYTDDWRTLGIVSPDEIEEDIAELSRGGDPHPQRYPWRRFVKFIHSRTSIDAALAHSLYALGESR